MNPPTTSHYPAAPTAQKAETHTLSVLVDNEPGVLARVIGLFSGRGYDIESLTVSETEHRQHLSLITIVTTGTPMVIEQIKNQLDRLVPVHHVVDMTLAGVRSNAARNGQGEGKGDNRVKHCGLRCIRARVITPPPKALCSRSRAPA
jgi:acetolactate synthase-1/3 small subunit